MRKKITKPNCNERKGAQNTFVQKITCKMLMKLTPRVNFINVLLAVFTAQIQKVQKDTVNLSVYFVLLVSTCTKAASKMLMKLTPELNFINIFSTAFTQVDLKCAKKDSQVNSVIWRFWDLRA